VTGHVAVRTCVGCRQKRPKKELVRFVITREGLAVGNADGRGTYLCRSRSCLDKALKGRGLRDLRGRAEGEPMLAELTQAVEGGSSGQKDRRHPPCEATGGGAIG
jgi:predicted RNA-binding protein YlxR (DUF448 family)